jgi:hypothetical protein
MLTDAVSVTSLAAALVEGAGLALQVKHPLDEPAAAFLLSGAAQVHQLVRPPDRRYGRPGGSVAPKLAGQITDETLGNGRVIRRRAAQRAPRQDTLTGGC